MSKKYTELLEKLKQDLAADMQYDVFIKSGVFEYINNIIKVLKDNDDDKFTFTSEKIKSITDEIINNKELKTKAHDLYESVKDFWNFKNNGKIPEFDPNVNWFTQNQKRYNEGDGSKYKKKTSLINSYPIQQWEWNDVFFGDVTNIINNVFYKVDDEIVEIKNIQIIQQDTPTQFTIIAYVKIINGGTK